MSIDKNALNALEKLGIGFRTDPKSAVSEWIELPDNVDAGNVIALINVILDPVSGKDSGLRLQEKPSHAALIELVEKSPIKELIFYDIERSRMTINGDLGVEEIKAMRELIRRNRVTFS